MTFSEAVKEIRKKKGMTQQEVADKMGITYQSYGQYESGRRTPKLDTKQRIAAALGVSLLELEAYGQDFPGGTVVLWDEDGDATKVYHNEYRAITKNLIDIFYDALVKSQSVSFTFADRCKFRDEAIKYAHKIPEIVDCEDLNAYSKAIEVFISYLPETDRKDILCYARDVFVRYIAATPPADHDQGEG